MNVVIYARFSDGKQREESIEGQIQACTEYAIEHNYTIIGEYIDRAFSAKTDDRPQFQKMIHDSSKKNFQAVIVYQLDRFARNRIDSAVNKQKLKNNGVTVISAKEQIAEGADGILMETVLEGFAEYFSADLSRKVNRGMNTNAEKCLSNGGTIPFGYRVEDGRYVINEKTAPIVQEIFKRYANGETAKSICDSLNARDIKTARGKTFGRTSLNKMLQNRKYLGIYIFNGQEHEGGIPQIIDKDLFEKVGERMQANKYAPARSKADVEYILSGKLYCGYCKEKMTGHSSNQITKKGVIFKYYKCKNSGGGKSCKKKMVKKERIEDIVIAECRKMLTPKNIKRIAKEIMRVVLTAGDKTELKRIEALIAKANEEKDNQMTSLRACKSDSIRAMIFEDLEKIDAELKELQRALEKEKARHYIVTEEQVVKYLEKLATGNINDMTYRKALIKMFVNKIFLYDDKYTITFNIGDEEVEITDKQIDEIEKELSGEKLCLLNNVVHQKRSTFCLRTKGASFQRNKSLAGFVKYASRVKYGFAM